MSNRGRLIISRVGETFELAEMSNPTAGYIWQVVHDEGLVDVDSEKFAPLSDRTGSKAKQTFRFVARREGEGIIKLVYKRPWEKGIVEEVDYKITVKPAKPAG